MRADTESPDQKSYRAARRAFIAACEGAHIDTVARLHPARAPDGKPLFMDCAALGPRRAARAVLIVAYDAAGTGVLIALLRDPPLPPEARLVLVHALDPAIFAGVAGDPGWPPAILGAVATEDLSRVRDLAVLPLNRRDDSLKPALQAPLPQATITVLSPAATAAQARRLIAAFFAGH
ncbi:MAG TPA: DUF2817 domain-containing protein [Rhizomicrobium sp.]|nr:DUF2817 domain-containing protein [Rhizomicrobium sp.]